MSKGNERFGARHVVAFLIIYLVWGSTFGAIHVALESVPPVLLVGLRFALAGLLLLTVSRLKRRADGTAPSQSLGALWLQAVPVGVALFFLSGTLLAWSEQSLPSSTAALLGCASPFFVVLFEWVRTRKAPGPFVLAGLGLGLAGVAVLVGSGTAPALQSVALLLGAGTTAFAMLWLARSPEGGLAAVGRQMVVGGSLGLVGSALFETRQATWTTDGALALVYLVFVGSALAYCAFAWLLARVPASLVSTHAFINPLVAVLLGAWLLSEPVGASSLLAGGLIVGAVLLLTLGNRQPRELEDPATPSATLKLPRAPRFPALRFPAMAALRPALRFKPALPALRFKSALRFKPALRFPKALRLARIEPAPAASDLTLCTCATDSIGCGRPVGPSRGTLEPWASRRRS